ncbi:hypothetical protein OG471_22815 [Streptomyces sp. NBC_01336]|uniref:hypothetical protein n=1 Tax=Streptomyces sp. NBC_01336 TaxID=2903829 RepID=UPI002E0DF8CA|nr:hypothetical protein OG471_22815 [Streptomyces sp. NBC_01336]
MTSAATLPPRCATGRCATSRHAAGPCRTARRAVYLLQFNSTAFADAFRDDCSIGATAGHPLAGVADTDLDESWSGGGKVADTSSYVFTEAKPYGAAQARQAYLVAGATVALIVQSRKGSGGTPRVPFHQTVILQNQLLG